MPPVDFETDAAAALHALQCALRRLVDGLPDQPRTATALERSLGVDRNLAWKVHRLVIATDSAVAAASVPGRAAMQIVANAGQRLGAAEGVVNAILDAERQYREMVRRHAGDRASASLMLGAQAGIEGAGAGRGGGAAGGGADIGLRRAAFRAMSFLAGVRVRTQLSAFLVAPGSDPERVDVLSIKGFYDIERVRAGAPFVMSRPRAAVGNAAYASPMPYGAIEAPPSGTGVPLLADFCSQPVPRFVAVRGEEGFDDEDELEDRPVGKTGACTVVRANYSPDLLPRFASPGDENAEVSTRLRTPCEVVVLDKFVHDAAYGDVDPRVLVYNDLAGEAAWVRERQSRLLVPVGGGAARVQTLGRGLGGVRHPDVPRYDSLLMHAFARLGWDPQHFTGYRVRIELPLIPSTVMLVHQQPARPPDGGGMQKKAPA